MKKLLTVAIAVASIGMVAYGDSRSRLLYPYTTTLSQ